MDCQVERRDKVIGIIGGLGPEATVDMLKKIIDATPASIEQEHIRVLVDNNPKTPCRIKAILDNGPSSGPVLAEMAKGLEKSGAELLVIACHTAHYYYDEINNSTSIPVLSIIEETVKELQKKHLEKRRIGLIASSALIQAGIYQKALLSVGLEVIEPSNEDISEVMAAIFSFKKGNKDCANKKIIGKVANNLIDRGAEIIILGCTELPMLLNAEEVKVPCLDSTNLLAKAAVMQAKGIA